jgi:hypothetical protein
MRWFRKFWVVLIFVVIVLQEQSWSEDHRRDYTVQIDFSCGGVDVKVITHCIYKKKNIHLACQITKILLSGTRK